MPKKPAAPKANKPDYKAISKKIEDGGLYMGDKETYESFNKRIKDTEKRLNHETSAWKKSLN